MNFKTVLYHKRSGLRGFVFGLFCKYKAISHKTNLEIKSTAKEMSLCAHERGLFSTGGGQRLVYRRLETPHMLHSGTVRLHSLHVLVQDGKDFIVQDLVLSNAVCHLLQGNILDYFIFAVLSLDFEQVVAEVKEIKATLLSQ